MYKLLLILFCGLTGLSAQAQSLKIQDLERFIHQSMTQVSNTLTATGWKLHAPLTGQQDEDYYRTFSYGNAANDNTKAMAWIRIHSTGTPVNRVYFQAPNQAAYQALLTELETLKTEQSPTEEIEAQWFTTYKGPDFAYQTIVSANSYALVVIALKFYETHAAPAP